MRTHFLIGFIGQIFLQLLNLLVLIVLARVLIPEQMGTLAFGMILVGYMNLVSDQGITTFGVRELSSQSDGLAQSAVVKLVIPMRLLMTAVAYLVACLLLIFFYPGDDITSIYVYLLTAFISCLNLQWYFNAMQNYVMYFVSGGMGKLIFILWVYIVPGDHSLLDVICKLLISELISVLLIFIYKIRMYSQVLFSRIADKWDYKNVVRKNVVTSSLILNDYFLNNLPLLILGFYLDAAVYSELNYAHRVAFLLVFPIVNVLTLVLIPELSKKRKSNTQVEFKKSLSRYLRIVWAVSIAYCAGYYFVGEYIFVFLFTTEYFNDLFLAIFTISASIRLISAMYWTILLSTEEKMSQSAIAAYFAVVNMLLSLVALVFFGTVYVLLVMITMQALWLIYMNGRTNYLSRIANI